MLSALPLQLLQGPLTILESMISWHDFIRDTCAASHIMGYVDIMVVDMDGYKGDQVSNWIYSRIYPIYLIGYPEKSKPDILGYTK